MNRSRVEQRRVLARQWDKAVRYVAASDRQIGDDPTFDRRADDYKGVIAWALDHRISMVSLALAAFWGALAVPYFGLVGSQMAPDVDT